MTIIPLWVKALAVAIAIALMGLAIHRLDLSRQDIGYQRAVAVYDKKLLAAQADAKAISDAWIERQRKEREEANERFNARDAAYAALSRTTDGLRSAATNYGNGLPDDTLTACRARADTLVDLFGQCSEALRDMAKAADGQFIDAISCRNQWPTLKR